MQKETMDNFIPRNSAWQCATCKLHIPWTWTCQVHKDSLPEEITMDRETCKDRVPKN